MMPATSEKHCPKPAAAMVLSPKATPIVRSMYSPAVIITRLSMNPKPTIGTAARIACRRSCCIVASGTGMDLPAMRLLFAGKNTCLRSGFTMPSAP